MKNILGPAAISLLLAVIVLWLVWGSQVHTEQSESERNIILLQSLISAIITFSLIFLLIIKFGSKINFLSHKGISLLILVIALILLFFILFGGI
jgi:presenilin-like A22 family membrane protease